MMRVPLIVCCVLGFAVALIAGYGYWRVNSHGTIDIHLRDVASQEQYGRIFDARIALLDASGRQLAAGKTDAKFGVVLIAHPQAGFCGPELQQSRYQKCHRALSAWLMEWAHDVRYVELEFGSCRFQRIPLQLSVFQAGMLTWWVPLPHVGGDPYTMFNAALTVNGKTCTLPDRDQSR
jgi:hypothetical protein